MDLLVGLGLGAVAGSAANAIIDRLPRRELWFAGRSHCDKCDHVLGVWDLIPVFSYVVLQGKCRYCHRSIAVRNLLVELVMAGSFVYLSNLGNLSYLGILWITLIIAVMDWETQLVSDWLVLVWGGLVVVSSGIGMGSVWGAAVAVGVIGGMWMLTRKRGMGEGDIGIAAVAGWWLGWPGIAVGLWVAFVAGGVIGGIRVIRGISGMKSKIAFGPFLIFGAWVGYVWGEKIMTMIF
ncbi:MAG: Prepilin peptidase [Candidatus Amesbacteria bacterium GW2011_GWA1_46_35]|uniref:Prepilin peptidase n=1 Tax=Candidatus Amesbacteria bacterium GW2011_GWC2_45_19 TaxID=1618366 RepID=A0A0G1M3Z5_9BACT|nr:MAG: Prepilin peptidase [Candidatus Amesbacteria bacterium GW2011_GWC2_45_19]KKU38355.1 MAG: Prepilin peptidase [Candidatus Amesbacteria bacterium GW2011_GWA1_46_35]KKU68802.1 MAG: Prepilin peptidase [Microgenomates group bacterium GW2011_GWC1_47_20]